ncbi:unnamed protein product [Lampetra fluviatilis]
MADTELPQLHKRRRRCLVAQICPFRRLGRKMRSGGTYDVGTVQVVSGGPGMWSPFEQPDPKQHEPPTLGVSTTGTMSSNSSSSSNNSSSVVIVELQQPPLQQPPLQQQQEVPDIPVVPAAHIDPDPEELVDPETGEVAQ